MESLSPDPTTAGGPTGAEPSSRVPTWLEHVAALGWRLLAVGALAAVILFALALLSTITASLIVVGIVLATTEPLVARLRARGWPRGKSAAAGWGAAMGGLVAMGAIAIIAVIPQLAHLVSAIQLGMDSLGSHLTDISLSPEVIAALEKAGTALKDLVAANLSAAVSSVSFLATVAILTFFLTFFAMLDADRAVVWILQAANDDQRRTLIESGHKAVGRVGGFIRGTTVIGAARAVATLAILWGLGVPDAASLAAIVFLGTFVPFIGVVAATAAVLAATLAATGPSTTLVVLGLTILTYVAVEILLRSSSRARFASLDPIAVIVALPVGAAIAGIFGLMLAVPVALAISAVAGAMVTALGSVGPEEGDDSIVPPWLDRLGQWSWRLLVGIAVVGLTIRLVFFVPFVVLPIVLAAVFAATLAPLVRALQKRGWTPTAAALAATGGAFVVSMAILALTFATLAAQVAQIVTTALAGASASSEALAKLVDTLGSGVQEAGGAISGIVDGLVRDSAESATAVLLSLLLCFFFLRDGANAWHSISSRLTLWRQAEADGAAGKAVTVLGGYMIATGVISAFGAGTQFLIMLVLGLPLALPLAVLSFFGGFIPYIGSFITTGIALLVTIAVGSPTDIAVMLAFTLIFNIVTGNIVAPLVYGRAVNIHPAVVLVAIPAGSAIGGILGMFLVVPIIGVIATVWRPILRVFGDPPAGTAGVEAPLPGDAVASAGSGPAGAPDAAGPAIEAPAGA